MRFYLRKIFVVALLATAGTTLTASKPIFWQTATLNDFLRGEVENLSVDGHGRLVLGPATELVAETTSPFLWAMVVAPDGSLYVGSGNEGKVIKVDPSGKDDDVFRFDRARSARAGAWRLTGRCTRRRRQMGAFTRSIAAARAPPFFDPEDKYIWSLALDQSGNLFAGTGEKGLIYKITPDGKGSTFYPTKATHVITLAFERERAASRRHRKSRAPVPHRCRREGISAARFDVSGNSRRSNRSAGKHLSRRAERTHERQPAFASATGRNELNDRHPRADPDGHHRSHGDCGR